MLDIIGNLKIDESKPERVKYFLFCLASWKFFNAHCKIFLNLEGASSELQKAVMDVYKSCGYTGSVSCVDASDYGAVYMRMLEGSDNEFVLNFIEDHFTVLNNADTMISYLQHMKDHEVDILKITFHKIEQNSVKNINKANRLEMGAIFRNTETNHKQYCQHYGSRYYIGVNFLTTRDFALKFWNRPMGHRPHEYEIAYYAPEWEHTCMVPSEEILCPVDDDHGEPNTCLLNRDHDKWKAVYEYGPDADLITDEPAPSVLEKSEPTSATTELLVTDSASKSIMHVKDDGRIFPERESKKEPPPPIRFNDLKEVNSLLNGNMDTERRWNEIISRGIYLMGPQMEEMEDRLSAHVGRRHCIAVKNCTDAIMMVLRHIMITRPDAPVILPNFGAYPTAIAAYNVTRNLIFVDVDESLTIDVKKLPEIKNGIILAVHLFGNHANMKALRRYADANQHIIVEDCAQSMGSGSGQTGEYAVFSFYPTKPLGCMGDGGAIMTDDSESAQAFRKMRFYGIDKFADPAEGEMIEHAGINSRMDEFQCAVINTKIDKFEQSIHRRTAIASRYKKIVDGIRINSNCIFHQFTVLFKEREKIIQALEEKKIPYMIHYHHHVSDMPVFKYLDHKVGFRVNDKIISLPCHEYMHPEHIEQVEKFLQEYKQYEY